MMVSFYPGPSKVYPEIKTYLAEAYDQGVLSLNHRSREFEEICKTAVLTLKEKLNIPQSYSVFFTSSATECWEIVAQSLVRKQSYHFFNGAFGEKWFEYTRRVHLDSRYYKFDPNAVPDIKSLKIFKETEVLCFTHNETSNGTCVPNEVLKECRDKFPELIIAADATSSLAGIPIDYSLFDIIFASVQKCFGLPAGLGVLICSPHAIKRAEQIYDKRRYNSLLTIKENMDKWQTSYTPNVLDIFLLMKIALQIPNIDETGRKIVAQAEQWLNFFNQRKDLKLLIENEAVRSKTVFAVNCGEETIKKVKAAAKEQGFVVGNGYGKLASTTFRIANFPAHTEEEINRLKQVLQGF